MALDKNTPVLVGFGQVTLRAGESGVDVSPAQVMAQASRAALADTEVLVPGLASSVDQLVVVDTMRRSMDNLPASLAAELGLFHARQRLAPVSGHVPQIVIDRICDEICRGESNLALIAGGEALRSARARIKRGEKPYWNGEGGEPELMFDRNPFATDHEREHAIWLAKDVYPLFETGLRAFYGRSVKQHAQRLGELWAGMSKVAVDNEHAWFREEKLPADILSVEHGNRMISYPYTKVMNAMNQVDQGAAVLIMSLSEAESRGIDPARWIFLHSAAEAVERGFVSERVNYNSSPAIAAIGKQALEKAGCAIEDIDYLDLYSCFPCAVELGRDALGISEYDPRPLTVTGGLSFAGGPGGSYVLTALTAMAKKLRANAGARGLITANGGLLAEHAVGIYSSAPPVKQPDYDQATLCACQVKIDSLSAPRLEKEPNGRGVVEAYTVVHGRDGRAERGIVIGRLEEGDNARFIANTIADQALFHEMEETEFVGRRGSVSSHEGINIFEPFHS